MNDDNLMFDTSVLEEEEIEFEKMVEEPVVSVATTTKSIPVSVADPITTVGEVVTTASASVKIPNELTLAQTLIEINTAKPKPVTTAATTVTSVRPRAKGIVFHDQEEQPEVPLKKKDQIALDEELALRLHAEEQAELEKERVAQEEASKATIIEELYSIQAMIDADKQSAARLQAEEQEQFSIEEKSRISRGRVKKHYRPRIEEKFSKEARKKSTQSENTFQRIRRNKKIIKTGSKKKKKNEKVKKGKGPEDDKKSPY
ncbi:hypothetical protein Tco_0660012 [Tanacetum coccineum]